MARQDQDSTHPPRRPAGTGTVRTRPDGRIELRLRLDGRPVSRYLPKGAGQRQITEALRDLAANPPPPRRPIAAPAAGETVAAYLARWLTAKLARGLDPSSARHSYGPAITRLSPYIGHIPLAALTRSHVQIMLDDLATRRSVATVKKTRSVLSVALNEACDLDLITSNPATRTRTPRDTRPERERVTAAGVRVLLAALEGTPERAVCELAAYTGLRLSEALGLRWVDVQGVGGGSPEGHSSHGDQGLPPPTAPASQAIRSLSSTALYVRGQLALDGTYKPCTKSRRPRTLPIVPAVAELLGRQGAGAASGFVFTDALGGPIRQNRVQRAVKRADVGFSFHGLRHYANGTMRSMGIDRAVRMAILGHSLSGDVHDSYGAVGLDDLRAALEALARALG